MPDPPGGGDTGAETTVDFGTITLKRSGNYLTWSNSTKPAGVPAIQESGAGGGEGATSGEINVKTLEVNVNTDVKMKNGNGRRLRFGVTCQTGCRLVDSPS